jgi:putative transposase
LAWLSANEPGQRELAFGKMNRGWVIGSDTFKRDLVGDQATEREVIKQTQAGAREVREVRWVSALEHGMKMLRKTPEDVLSDAKSADWKVALAADMKQRLMCTNRWLGGKLNMGPAPAVCRYVSEALDGRRPAALQYLESLKINH